MGRGEQQCACPRCGYDLQGQVAAWHAPSAAVGGVAGDGRSDPRAKHIDGEFAEGARCPLQGLCSECGLTFEWRAIFRAELFGPGWFMETRKCGWLRAFLGTAMRALHVDAFFKRGRGVSLETPTNRWAMWSYVGAILIGLPCGLWLVELVAGMAWFAGVNTWGGPKWQRTELAEQLSMVIMDLPRTIFDDVMNLAVHNTPAWLALGGMMTLTMIGTILLLPMSRAKSKVLKSHVVRAGAYGLSWIVGVAAIYLTFRLGYYVATLADIIAGANGTPSRAIVRVGEFCIGMSNLSDPPDATWFIVSIGRSVLIAAWILVYWWFVMRYWWRMDDARIVFAAVAVPAVLAGLVGVVWTGL